VVSKLLGDQIKDFLLVGDIRERDRSRVKIRDPFFFFFPLFSFLERNVDPRLRCYSPI